MTLSTDTQTQHPASRWPRRPGFGARRGVWRGRRLPAALGPGPSSSDATFHADLGAGLRIIGSSILSRIPAC